jgi:hypothetical protein
MPLPGYAEGVMPELDRISFVATPPLSEGRSRGIRILINGEDLVDLVAAQERPRL